MNFYDNLVMQTQMNYSKYYHIYASGSTPYQLTDKKPLPYSEQINRLVQEIKEADCVVVGGASGLSAAGGGDFYYEDNDSYRKYFRPFAEKYHFKGAFAGMMHPWETREEYWGYLATFLHTTQTAPVRHPYPDALQEKKREVYPDLRSFIRAVAVPEMQIKLKQGFGRAIRLETDTCAIAILDERAARGSRYFQDVQSALPEMPITSSIYAVERFIRRVKDESYFEEAA